MAGFFDKVYNPDVLSCLANLSNDEVFTPPEIANQMLDALPEELFQSAETTFLDPACKSGVFLREIAKRLLNNQLPNYEEALEVINEKKRTNTLLDADEIAFEQHLQETVDHIFHHQLFGISITELTSLLSRRSVYCSKYPNSEFSISQFDTSEGNIRFRRTEHSWDKSGKCVFCGASKEQYERGDKLETHAYEWIHTTKPEEIFDNMKFDVVIANPPYQMEDSGNGVSATPIFQHFVTQAIKLAPRFVTMIIPARWYAGGKGLDSFRESMLNDPRIRKLVDFESSKDCFDGVNIAGGICYFLWERDNKGLCQITNQAPDAGSESTVLERSLREFPILIRSNLAISIVHKILDSGIDVHSNHAYPRNPFGYATNFRGRNFPQSGDIEIITSVGGQYIPRSDVKKNADIIDCYKVLIGRLVPSNGELNVSPKDGYRVITDTRIIGPGQINTETYLDIGVFQTKEEALNFNKYLKSKFPRFLLRQAISSLNVTRECFRFVPHEDFTQEWTDEKLYAKYGLTDEEIAFIESMIKPMDLGGDD